MAKYNVIPNANYNNTPFFKTFNFNKIEKIIWFKHIGDYLDTGDILCEIHYDDCIFEMECKGGDYLLYKNMSLNMSFSNILSIFGKKDEDIQSIFTKHKEDLKNYDTSNDPNFTKKFLIKNICSEDEPALLD